MLYLLKKNTKSLPGQGRKVPVKLVIGKVSDGWGKEVTSSSCDLERGK